MRLKLARGYRGYLGDLMFQRYFRKSLGMYVRVLTSFYNVDDINEESIFWLASEAPKPRSFLAPH